jgi:hypothetical protein
MIKIIKKIMRLFFPGIAVALAAALAVAIAVSCSSSRPEITFGFIQLLQYQTNSGVEERYSFFIIPDDDDGLENLDELRLYHDREQLCWVIKSDEWIRHSQDGKDWIGTRSIAVSGESLPRGLFRAALTNKGGEKGERLFSFDGDARFPFPELKVSEGRYEIKSEWPANRLVCLDASGNYVATVELKTLAGALSELRLPSAARAAALWAEDSAYFCGAYTNAVSVR